MKTLNLLKFIGYERQTDTTDHVRRTHRKLGNYCYFTQFNFRRYSLKIWDMQLNKTITIKTPTIPNFIIGEDGTTIPIGYFTKEELQRIGEQWTKELIEKAAKRR